MDFPVTDPQLCLLFHQLNNQLGIVLAHAELLDRLADQKFAGVSPALLAELETFYADPSLPFVNKKDRKAQARLQSALEQLKGLKKHEVIAENH